MRNTGTSLVRTVLATAGFLAVAAFFLTTEHRAHLFGLLPFLLLLACPLLHVFGHGGHKHGQSDGSPAQQGGAHGDHAAGRERAL